MEPNRPNPWIKHPYVEPPREEYDVDLRGSYYPVQPSLDFQQRQFEHNEEWRRYDDPRPGPSNHEYYASGSRTPYPEGHHQYQRENPRNTDAPPHRSDYHSERRNSPPHRRISPPRRRISPPRRRISPPRRRISPPRRSRWSSGREDEDFSRREPQREDRRPSTERTNHRQNGQRENNQPRSSSTETESKNRESPSCSKAVAKINDNKSTSPKPLQETAPESNKTAVKASNQPEISPSKRPSEENIEREKSVSPEKQPCIDNAAPNEAEQTAVDKIAEPVLDQPSTSASSPPNMETVQTVVAKIAEPISDQPSASSPAPATKNCQSCENEVEANAVFCLSCKPKRPEPKKGWCLFCNYNGNLIFHSMSKHCPECERFYPCQTFFRKHYNPNCQFLQKWKASGVYPPILDRLMNEEQVRLPPSVVNKRKNKPRPRRTVRRNIRTLKQRKPLMMSCDTCRKQFSQSQKKELESHFSRNQCLKCKKKFVCFTVLQIHRSKCKFGLVQQKMMKITRRKDSVDSPTACEHCNVIFRNDKECRSHKHAKRCFKCDKSFKCKTLLDKHIDDGHPKTTSDESSSSDEESAKEEVTKYECCHCQRNFKTQVQLATHQLKKTCMHCSETVDCSEFLVQHNQSKHFVCMFCNKANETKNQLDQHQMNITCEICSKLFKCETSLKGHFTQVHKKSAKENVPLEVQSDPNFKCACGKTFPSANVLADHQFPRCTQCEKEYSCVTYLRRHQANSTCSSALNFGPSSSQESNSTSLQCEHCGTKFISEQKLQFHQYQKNCRACRTVLGCAQKFMEHKSVCKADVNKRVKCNLCNKMLGDKRLLYAHQKPSSCGSCRETLPCVELMVKHKLKCMGEKRSKQCTHCKMKVGSSIELITHTRAKSCPECQWSSNCATLFSKHTCQERKTEKQRPVPSSSRPVQSTSRQMPSTSRQVPSTSRQVPSTSRQVQLPRQSPSWQPPEANSTRSSRCPTPQKIPTPKVSPVIRQPPVGTPLYRCSYCHTILDTEDNLSRHQREFQCSRCSYTQPCSKLLMDHVEHCRYELSAESGLVVCTVCKRTFASALLLGLHVERQHPVSDYSCDECGRVCHSKGKLNFHKMKKHPADSYQVRQAEGNRLILVRNPESGENESESSVDTNQNEELERGPEEAENPSAGDGVLEEEQEELERGPEEAENPSAGDGVLEEEQVPTAEAEISSTRAENGSLEEESGCSDAEISSTRAEYGSLEQELSLPVAASSHDVKDVPEKEMNGLEQGETVPHVRESTCVETSVIRKLPESAQLGSKLVENKPESTPTKIIAQPAQPTISSDIAVEPRPSISISDSLLNLMGENFNQEELERIEEEEVLRQERQCEAESAQPASAEQQAVSSVVDLTVEDDSDIEFLEEVPNSKK